MKSLICIVLILFAACGAFAQTDFTFGTFQTDFTAFAQAVANSLPFNANVGLNWSDAYIGQLIELPPHFGIGATVGATTIPFSAVQPILHDMGDIQLPPELDFVKTIGFPIPAYTIDARIGGFILPFDIGLKLGYVPQGFLEQQLGMKLDVNYILAGADVRIGILKDKDFVPALSIGVGYTYMDAGLTLPDLLGGDIHIASFDVPNASGGFDSHTIDLTDPSLNFTWSTNVIDLKVQVSKSLLILTPSIGLGVSYGFSNAGGGLTTALLLDGATPTAEQIALINQAFQAAGQTIDLSDKGFHVSAAAQGWAIRAFGGLSLNLLIIRLDVGAMYNFTSGSYGATVNVRLQL